jgi:biopolymer transport protein TolQ
LIFGDLSSLMSLPVASVIDVFFQSTFSGKVIVFMLVIGSIWAWSLILTKHRELSLAEKQSADFIMAYRGASHPAALYNNGMLIEGASPLHEIYQNACCSLGASLEGASENPDDLFTGGGSPRISLSDRHINSARGAADRTVADQAILLEKRMGLLATAASAAPFLGLLGTVMGVMTAFSSMASSGPALLSDVAPGISGALLTTVVGLVVALPSSIGYNILSDRIRCITVMMDNFAQEFIGDLERIHIP